MLAIAGKEFKSLSKSIKSIIIILLILSATLGIAKILNIFEGQLKDMGLGDNPYNAGLMIITFLLGPLFVFVLSHNTINEEINSRTIRFLVTKTSRTNIVLGKFIGILLFWTTIIFITVVSLGVYTGEFYFSNIHECITFLSYFITLAILLSIIIDNPIFSNFIGLAVSLTISVIGIWSTFSDKILLNILSYVTPYYYFKDDNGLMYITLLLSVLFIIASLYLIKRRDL